METWRLERSQEPLERKVRNHITLFRPRYPVSALPRPIDADKKLECMRLAWVLEVMPIRGPYGPGGAMATIGNLDIVDGEEAYDMAYKFAKDHGCDLCPFYKQLASNLCYNPIVTCTRHRAKVWTRVGKGSWVLHLSLERLL